MPFEIQFNKFGEPNYPYIYEILHKPTGSVYVGISKANKKLKNGYWGTACGKSNKLMHRKTILNNIQDYQKTILMYFNTYDEAAEYEKKKIKEYLKEYNNLCLNRNVGGTPTKSVRCMNGKNVGQKNKDKIFIHKDNIQKRCYQYELTQKLSEGWIKGKLEIYFGINPYANRTEEQMKETKEKCSNSAKQPKTLYYCPYDKSIIKVACGSRGLGNYIKENFPNEKKWDQYTYNEKQNFRIK